MPLLRTLDEIIAVVTTATAITTATAVTAPTDAGPRPHSPAAASRADGPARTIIGITGSPGTGKTTFAEALVARLNTPVSRAQLVSMDGFHLPQARLVELGRRDRMGAPDTLDVDGFVHLLRRLRSTDGPVTAPGFDRETEEATPGTVQIDPDRRILVVEGNYLLHDRAGWKRVAPLLNLSLFVGVDRSLHLARLVARHERYGKSATDARAWALGPDEANARLIELTRARADHEIRLG
ncbi:nucleoside/nucleotide kinase family protein [Cryobacterium sp. TMT2-23]|uniref:nucleoside/nucleotide kinase family protein n=1 Tax=Cryobacterium sp. TMT2-23 TaxID=1259252 RepID=UPI00106D6B45|nr:nucleoside/nucleotide kinase family protein [Cryobacterium sp. TMT2-23]TFD26238.1 nucleoside/nucleotide kinase family protein [Cryobacterium sp. TMT2-23]